MDHRQPLLDMLDRYVERFPGEEPMCERVRELVTAHEDCFERSCVPGHVTASAFILSPDREKVLLTHHKKLDLWLQLGGHADGDTYVADVALREAQEESGMEGFDIVTPGDGEPLPLDVDVHVIPAHGDEPQHEHHDIRFLLVAWPEEEITVSDESHDVQWVDWNDLEDYTSEVSILRMADKARLWLQENGAQDFDFDDEFGGDVDADSDDDTHSDFEMDDDPDA